MAIAVLTPDLDTIDDPVTIKEAAAMFAETGYPVPESTLRRWARKAGLRSERGQYSDSDLLELHARKFFGSDGD